MAISKRDVLGLANKDLPPDKQSIATPAKDNPEMNSAPVVPVDVPFMKTTMKFKIVEGTNVVPKISNQPKSNIGVGGNRIPLNFSKIEKKG